MIAIDSIIAALILSCTSLQQVELSKPTREDQVACIQRITACAKKKAQSATYGESVLDCAKEIK